MTSFQLDDLESFEHSKCKPVSLILVVENKTRRILAFQAMAAKGHLAKTPRKKYGPGPDLRSRGRAKLFTQIQAYMETPAEIGSDKSSHYPKDIQKYFPQAIHRTTKGRRGWWNREN